MSLDAGLSKLAPDCGGVIGTERSEAVVITSVISPTPAVGAVLALLDVSAVRSAVVE